MRNITLTNEHPTYAEHLVRGLLTFAEHNEVFADWLHLRLFESSIPFEETLLVTREHQFALMPTSLEQAVARALWLVGRVEAQAIEGYSTVGKLLSGFARIREYEEPKAIVLGLEIGVLPIGLMGKMKSRREPMNVIIRDSFFHTVSPGELTRQVTSLTHHIIERALIDAQGSTAHLEPEIGDWLFGDKQLSLFHADEATMRTLGAFLEVHHLPYAYHTEEDEYALIVPSPTLYLADLPHADTLEKVAEC
jgi:hypothetical protein